jgi:hypothetical protein
MGELLSRGRRKEWDQSGTGLMVGLIRVGLCGRGCGQI